MVELAVALPLLVTLVFGAIELADGFFFEETLVTAAYEGAREAARSKESQPQAIALVKEFLESRGVTEYTIEFRRGRPDGATADRKKMVRGRFIYCIVKSKRSSWSPIQFGFLGDSESKRYACFMVE